MMRSKRTEWTRNARNARDTSVAEISVKLRNSRSSRFLLSTLRAGLARSTNTHPLAPRDRASIPDDPPPAKRSRTRAPRTLGPSQSKRPARARAIVGRVSVPDTERSFRPRRRPATIRIAPLNRCEGGRVGRYQPAGAPVKRALPCETWNVDNVGTTSAIVLNRQEASLACPPRDDKVWCKDALAADSTLAAVEREKESAWQHEHVRVRPKSRRAPRG